MIEPRKQHRHHLIFYLKVFRQGNREPIGFLGDITTEGMMVMSKEPITVGETYELEIQNHSELTKERMVRAVGESVWSHSDVNPDYYATGFRFINLSHDDERAVRNIIRELGFTE